MKFKKAALRRGLLLLVFGLLILAVILVSAKDSLEKTKKDDLKVKDKDFDKSIGGVKEGKSIWHLKEGFLLQNVTPETSQVGEYVEVEFENDSKLDNLNISLRFYNGQAKVDFFEVLRNVSKYNTVFNRSVVQFFNATNASFYNITATNISLELSSEIRWVNVPPKILNNNTMTYYTIPIVFGEKVKVKPISLVYGGTIKYDIITSSSTDSNEIDPVFNASTFNITSNSDLNTTAGCIGFVDGKLPLGCGNKSNLTGYVSWAAPNNNVLTNPAQKQFNITAGAMGGKTIVRADQGFLNITLNSVDANGENVNWFRDVNLSVPASEGIIVDFYVDEGIFSQSAGSTAGVCFSVNWDRVANQSTVVGADYDMPCYNNQNSYNGLGFVRANNNVYRLVWSAAGVVGTSDISAGKSDGIAHWTGWTNCTHARYAVNLTEGGGIDTGVVKLGNGLGADTCSGKVGAMVVETEVATDSFIIYNLTVNNATQFGQPFNWTGGRLESNVLNSTAVVTTVLVTNVTNRHTGTELSLFVWDANHLNQQSITEGNWNTITSITGIGINGSTSPGSVRTVSELSSIDVQWNILVQGGIPASAPSVNVSLINQTSSNASVITKTQQLFGYANYSNNVSGSLEENSTFKWFKRTLYQPQNRSLVGYWKLDGNANDSSSAAANHGTVINATPNQSQDCRVDECLYFDGVDDFINFSSVSGLADSGGALSFQDNVDFTLELWYKGTEVEMNGIYGKGLIGQDDGGIYGNLIVYGGLASYAHYDTKWLHINSTTNISNNAWHHIAYVNYNNETGRLYVDGVLEATASSSFSDANKYFKANGLMRGFSNKYTRGSIDEVAIYSYAKSAAEISADYRNSPYSAMIYRDAVAYWHFDSVNGSNVTFDSSGRGNNGNLSGFNQSNATTAGIIGSGLKFDGIDDYVGLGNPRLFGGNVSNASITFWVKPADNWNTDSKRDFIFNDIASSVGIQLAAMEDNGDLRVLVGNGTQDTVYFADVNWKKDVWTHIGIAYNGTHFLFYQDGSLASVNATTLRSIGESELTTATIGVTPNTLNGTLDEFAIYNRTLSSTEVKQLYFRTWYDYSPEVLLWHGDNASNSLINATIMGSHSPTASFEGGVNCTTDVTGYYGQACQFDGVNDAIFLPNTTASVDITGQELTMEFWMKATNNQSAYATLVGKYEDANAQAAYYVARDSSNNRLFMIINNGSGDVTPTFGTGIFDNNWHYVAITYDGTQATSIRMYVDGLLNASQTGVTGNVKHSRDRFIIGAGDSSTGASARFFNGTIDEVRVNRKALTAQEINLSYSKGRAFFQNEYLLNSSNYNRGDALILEYFPTDNSSSNGNKTNSSSILVQDTPPTIPKFDRPANNSFFNVTTVVVNVTNGSDADGDSLTTYCYLDDGFSSTSTGNCTYSSLANGNHTARVQFYDGTEFGSNSSLLNFTIDTIAPAISFVANTPANNSFLSTNYIFINTSENDAGNDHNDFSAFVDFNNSLVGYWRFEDDGDTNASDFTNYNNNGTLENFSCTSLNCNLTGGPGGIASGWTSAGKRGKGLAFDSLNDLVRIPYSANLQPKTAITLEAWVFLNRLGPGYQSVIQYPFSASLHDDPFFEYAIYISNVGAVHTRIDGESSSNFGTVAAGTWNHVAVVWDGSTTIVTYYVNGTSVGTYDGTKTSITYDSNNPVLIGANIAMTERVNGTIDEVKVWSRALDAQEINASYQAGTYRLSANLTGLNDGNYTYRAYVVDSAGNVNQTLLQNFTVDTVLPSVSNTLFASTGGITVSPLIFGSTMDWIAATVTDAFLTEVNISVRDGAGIVVVENKLMTNQGSNVWNYTTDISLSSGAGNWTINISAYDNASNRGFQLTNFTLNTQNVSTKEGLYGYGNDTPLSVADIAALSSYGYDVFENSDNASTMGNASSGNFATLLAVINASNSASSLVGINYKLDFNYSIPNEVAKARGNISVNFPNLKNAPYVVTVSYISFELVNQTLYNDTDKTAALNDLALNATNAFTTAFPIYSKNFNNSNLTSAYIKATPLIYVYAGSQAELITDERDMLRNNKSLNRIYVNLTTPLKSQAKNYHNDVVKQLRGTPSNNANLADIFLAEIDTSVNDAVIFNIGASESLITVNATNISGLIGKDVWDATQKKLLANNTNGTFVANVSAYSANLIFAEDIDHVQLDSSVTGDVFKASTPSVLSLNYTDGTRDSNYALYGANDARIELYDPHYIGNNFLTYYGWINASTVNLSNKIPYATVIIADQLDKEIDKLNYSSTAFYGYISVADYANTNAWVTGKEGEVDTWVSLNGSLQIFIDGLDSGIGGTNFSSRFKDVVDYTRIAKGKKVILNTYTAYINFSTWGDGVMKESCVNRWNGADPTNPTSYSREDWSLELNHSIFFQNHNIPVYCQAFNNRTSTFNQITNYTDLLNIYYASKVLGYQNFYLSQPDFNYVHTEYVPDLGTDLSRATVTEDNVTYYRRFSNGIVYYNTSSTQGWLDDGRTALNTRLCFDLYDNHANGVTFSFTVNREVTGAEPGDYNISDSELGGQGVWTTVCRNLNATEQNFGRWDVQLFVLPRTTIVGQGGNIGNADVLSENRHSWYDSSTSPNSWTQYGMGTNWQINLEINDTKKASVDTINTITQSEANATVNSVLLQNVTLSSGFDVNTEVWSNPTFVNSTTFINLTYLAGTGFSLLYPQNNTDCTSSSPTFNTTTISGNAYKSCITPSGTGYYLRVAPYKLSTQTFQGAFGANTAPNNPVWITPINNTNTSSNALNYSATDPENDALTYYIYVNGIFNQTSSGNVTLAATPEQTYWVNVSAYDGSLFSANVTVYFLFDNRTALINNATNSNATIGNPIYLPKNSVFLNFTYTEPYNSTFTIQNGTGGVNNNITAVTANGVAFWYTFTGLNDANYTFKGYINDTAGNVNRSANISIAIDTTFPVPVFMPPTPTNNSVTSNNRVNISTNVTETNFMNMTINIFNQTGLLNRTGFTTPNASVNYTFNDGVYQVTITAYDLANNSNTSLGTNFTVDTTAPNISIELPLQDSEVGSVVTFQYQVNDTVGVSQCNLTSSNMGGFTNGTALNVSNGNENTWVNDTGQSAGYQISFNIRCIDTAGNTAITPQRTFSIAKAGQTGTGSSGSDFLGETTKKVVCGEGDQEISYQNSTYCVTCAADRKVVVSDGKFSCLEATELETKASIPISTPSIKGAAILFSLTIGSYILGGTDLILRGRKVKKRG